MVSSEDDPSQFYTGLISELYDHLVSARSASSAYKPFIDLSGQPILEPFCGSGHPLLDLLEMGYDIDGLDASADMLDRLKTSAQTRGLKPTVYHQKIQDMDLPRKYRTIFIAGASLVLLTSDETAMAALKKLYDHLEPGGSILIPLLIHKEDELRAAIGERKRHTLEDGTILQCQSTAVEFDAQNNCATSRLFYERISPDGTTETTERDWLLRWWPQDRFRDMLNQTGFDKISCLDEDGKHAPADASTFAFLARKSRD